MPSIDALPVELILMILIRCLPTIDPENKNCWYIDSQLLVLRLGMICRSWRDLTIRTPELWTDIRIEGKSTLAHTEMWLDRARDRPLHINIYIDDGDPEREMARCIGALRMKADQWSTLQIAGRHLDPEGDVATLFVESLPNLTDALISNGVDDGQLQPFPSAPRLQRLSLGGEGLGIFTFRSAPLLTHCTITEFITYRGWRDQWLTFIQTIASSSPLLEVLEVKTPSYGDADDDDEEPWEDHAWPSLGHLKKLVLDGCRSWTLNYILTHINAPTLQTIHLANLGYSNDAFHTVMLPCKEITIDHSRFADIRLFAAGVSNAQDIVMKVDFMDAARLSLTEPKEWETRRYPETPEQESLVGLIEHFEWFATNAKVEWTLPNNIMVPGTIPMAWKAVAEAFWECVRVVHEDLPALGPYTSEAKMKDIKLLLEVGQVLAESVARTKAELSLGGHAA